MGALSSAVIHLSVSLFYALSSETVHFMAMITTEH